MALDIADAEDSFLYGFSEFQKWLTEFEARWRVPDELLYMGAAVKDAGFEGMLENPGAVMRLDELVKRMTGREK